MARIPAIEASWTPRSPGIKEITVSVIPKLNPVIRTPTCTTTARALKQKNRLVIMAATSAITSAVSKMLKIGEGALVEYQSSFKFTSVDS
jgi:hypothetical protein